MIFKFTVITPKSLVLIKPTITKAGDNETLYNVITSKNYNIENIIEVLTGDSFTCLTSVDIDVLNEITLPDLKSQGKTIHLKVILNGDEEVQGDETQLPPAKRLKTLMDIARVESSWPSYKNTDQVTYLSKYMEHFAKEPAQAIADLDSCAKDSKLQTKVLLFYAILILFKQHCCGVFQENVVNFSNLCQAVRDLLWYVSPHADKFKIRGASLPIFFASLQSFNNPRRHGHALISDPPYFRSSVFPIYRISDLPYFRSTVFLIHRISDLRYFRSTLFPIYRISDLPYFRSTVFLIHRISDLPYF